MRRLRRRSRMTSSSSNSSITSRNFAQQRAKLFDNMPDHTNMIFIMTVARFVLAFLLIASWTLRILAYIILFITIYCMKFFDFMVYLFHRVFSTEPDRINQNPDYTHIEGKSKRCLDDHEMPGLLCKGLCIHLSDFLYTHHSYTPYQNCIELSNNLHLMMPLLNHFIFYPNYFWDAPQQII